MSNLVDIAAQTVYVSQTGEYSLGSRRICKFNRENKSVLIREGSFKSIEKTVKSYMEKHRGMPVIEIRNESTVTAVHRLCNFVKGKDKRLVGVLNFASAHNPGGGFLGGAMAQEEALAYCSDLYVKQTTGQSPEFYKINEDVNSAYYTNTMIMSNVNFFRDANYNFVPYNTCWVLTSPAVNQRLVTMRGELKENGYAIMRERMRKILQVFIYCGCTDIILGAFGCGVFGNEPEVIAKYWKELLIDEGLAGYFDSITFSVYDHPDRKVKNIDFFKKEFSNYIK